MSLAVAVRRLLPGRGVLDRVRQPGRAEPYRPGPGLRAALDTSGTVAGYLHNLKALGPGGALLVQPVTGPDGRRRYVVQLGPAAAGTSYARAVVKALRDCAPSGAELALIGRGPGARTALRLAAAPEFTAVYTVTHVITADRPGPHLPPAAPGTRVLTVPATADTADEALTPYRGRPATPRLFTLHPR